MVEAMIIGPPMLEKRVEFAFKEDTFRDDVVRVEPVMVEKRVEVV